MGHDVDGRHTCNTPPIITLFMWNVAQNMGFTMVQTACLKDTVNTNASRRRDLRPPRRNFRAHLPNQLDRSCLPLAQGTKIPKCYICRGDCRESRSHRVPGSQFTLSKVRLMKSMRKPFEGKRVD